MRSPLFQPFPMLAGRRAQVWRYRPAYRRPRHFHDEPELNVVVRGWCVMGVGNAAVHLAAGQLVSFAPGQDHVLLDSSSDLDLFVLALAPELAARVLGPRPLYVARPLALAQPELEPLDRELTALGEVRDAAAAERGLAEVFERVQRHSSGMHVLARRALELVRADPGLAHVELCERLASGASDISRRFHRDLGVPLVEYRVRLRLMQFVTLVDRGTPLTRAAYLARFGSYAQCHRVFRRVLGCSPSEYFAGARSALDEAVERAERS